MRSTVLLIREHEASQSRGIDGHGEQFLPSASTSVILVHIYAQMQDEPAGEHGPDSLYRVSHRNRDQQPDIWHDDE